MLQLPHVPNSAVSSPVGPSRGSTDFPLDGITLAGLLQDSDDLLTSQLRPTHLAPIFEDAARGEGEDESGIVMTGGGEDDDESVEGRQSESEGQTTTISLLLVHGKCSVCTYIVMSIRQYTV